MYIRSHIQSTCHKHTTCDTYFTCFPVGLWWHPTRGDSLVDGKHLFEIGGEKKTFAQIKNMPDSYLAIDGIEVGRGCRIPLWLFGFLY